MRIYPAHWKGLLLRCILLFFAVGPISVRQVPIHAQGQTNIPPIPTVASTTVLYPGSILTGVLDNATTEYWYVVLSHAGDKVSINVKRSAGNFAPLLELFDAGKEIIDHKSADLA